MDRGAGRLHTGQAPASRIPTTSSWPVSQAWLLGNSLDPRKGGRSLFQLVLKDFIKSSPIPSLNFSFSLCAAISGSCLNVCHVCRLSLSPSPPLNRNPDTLSQARSRSSISPSGLTVVCPRYLTSPSLEFCLTPSSSAHPNPEPSGRGSWGPWGRGVSGTSLGVGSSLL